MKHKRLTWLSIWLVIGLLLPALGPASVEAQAGGWEWQNPLPQGNTLHGVWGSSGSDVFAVGSWGTILHYDGTGWGAMTSDTSESLHSIWGSSSSDVFAVGSSGTIVHYDGTEWGAMTSGTTQDLSGVWGSSGSGAFAVGSGTILHYDGEGWSEMSSGTPDYIQLYGVWGSSGTDVFAVGWLGNILHYDGTGWGAMTSGTSESLLGVWGSSGTDVFAVGGSGNILHYDGTSWGAMDSGIGNELYGVWGSSDSDVFTVGSGTILHYDGGGWSEMSSGTGYGLYAVWGSSGGNVFAVGWLGNILHYDGAAWSPMSSSIEANQLNGVWGSSGSNVFAVGDYGTIVRYDGAGWGVMTSGTTSHLRDVWGSSGSNVFAVGDYGTILRYDGAAWSPMSSGTGNDLYGVWGGSGSDVFAVGWAGIILHYDGEDWSTMSSGMDIPLRGVWGSNGSDVFAVGYGTILHYDGEGWTEMSSGTPDYIQLYGVWGNGGSDVFAVGGPWGGPGTIVHYDGATWSVMSSGMTNRFFGVWGSNGGDVFAVGDSGTILHYDGTSWGAMDSSTGNELYGVWGSSGSDVFVVGSWGTILHLAQPGVYLIPSSQSGSGEPGATVSYMFTLANYSGLTDSFTLTLGDHAWETTLSTDSLGPLADGESATFTVEVSVPAEAECFSSDTVVVTASSEADPTVLAEASLTTQAYAPPQMSVTPDSLTSSQYVNEVTTQDLTISNAGFGPLEFTAGGGLVLWNKLGSDDEVLNSEFGENGTIVGTAYAYEEARYGNGYVRKETGLNYLRFPASVLDDLHERGAIELWINPKVPQPIPFEYGVFGLVGAPFGHGGVPGDYNIWLMWGDTVTQQGFFGGVKFDYNEVQTPAEPTQFVATPSVPFHAAICWDIAGIDGTDDKVRVYRDGQIVGSTTASWNPAGPDRYDIILGYGPDGGGYDKFIVDNIKIWNYAKADFSDRFAEGSTTGVSWLSLDPGSGTVPAGGSVLVHVTFDSTVVQPGTHTAQIVVQSNDPVTPMATVPVAMTVLPTASMGWVEGTVSQAWSGNPVAATITALGQPYTVATDPSTGYYKLWLEGGSYTLQVTSPGYLPQTAEVSITAGQGTTQDFALSLDAPPPVASFWFDPYDPSTFDIVQFYDWSYDPSGVGIGSQAWDLGDGTTAEGCCPTHQYAADGDYIVQLTVTTEDGRSASTSQVVRVRTHDVAIAKFLAPKAARVGQTRSIVVGISNVRYPERVEVQLYKSTPEGDQWLGSTLQSVPVRPARRTTDFTYTYTFTADDASAGAVTFRAVANVVDARDALPADNEATAATTRVTR